MNDLFETTLSINYAAGTIVGVIFLFFALKALVWRKQARHYKSCYEIKLASYDDCRKLRQVIQSELTACRTTHTRCLEERNAYKDTMDKLLNESKQGDEKGAEREEEIDGLLGRLEEIRLLAGGYEEDTEVEEVGGLPRATPEFGRLRVKPMNAKMDEDKTES